jgi:short-subunit dehydrogenase
MEEKRFISLYNELDQLRVQVKDLGGQAAQSQKRVLALARTVARLEESQDEIKVYVARIVQELDAKKEQERVAVIQEVTSTDKSYRLITAAISVLTLVTIVVAIFLAVYLKR